MKAQQREHLLQTLQARFEKHARRHAGIEWPEVQRRLEAGPDKLRVLEQMEATGGEPDVVGVDSQTGQFVFCDCSAESPAGRRSVCYARVSRDGEGLIRGPDDGARLRRAAKNGPAGTQGCGGLRRHAGRRCSGVARRDA